MERSDLIRDVAAAAYPDHWHHLEQLVNAAKLNHATLFVGPELGGQATLAGAFADLLLCQEGTARCRPRCHSCQERHKGIHPDLRQVHGSVLAPIGVDDAGAIARHLASPPVLAPWRVVMINEAHCLTMAASNAILKTIEEPPSRSIVLLTSSRPDQLPATVRSRVQSWRVPLLDSAAMTAASALLSIDPERRPSVEAIAAGRLGLLIALGDADSVESVWWRDQLKFWLDFLSSETAQRDRLIAEYYLQPTDAVERQHDLPAALGVLEILLREAMHAAAGAAVRQTFPQFRATIMALGARLGKDGITERLATIAEIKRLAEAHGNKKMILEYLIFFL